MIIFILRRAFSRAIMSPSDLSLPETVKPSEHQNFGALWSQGPRDSDSAQCNGYVEGRGNRGLKLILQSNMQTMHIILLKSNI